MLLNCTFLLRSLLYVFPQSTTFYFLHLKKILVIKKYIYLFLVVLGLCCCARAFLSCGEQGFLLIAVHRLFTVVASLVSEHRHMSFSSCKVWAPERPVFLPLAFIAPQLMESSQTRGQTCVPCIGKWILTYCTNREVLTPF